MNTKMIADLLDTDAIRGMRRRWYSTILGISSVKSVVKTQKYRYGCERFEHLRITTSRKSVGHIFVRMTAEAT